MNWGARLIRLILRFYKVAVSPALHLLVGPFGGCRFAPTCSAYAAEAVALHGVIKGTVLAVQRICRCHPWGDCGEDPVPQHFKLRLLNWRPCGAENEGRGNHVDIQRPVHFGCPPPQ